MCYLLIENIVDEHLVCFVHAESSVCFVHAESSVCFLKHQIQASCRSRNDS